MHRSNLTRYFAIALIAVPGIPQAHHSQGMFVDTPVWVTGTISKYRATDPHVMIELQEPQADGKGKKWIVEGPRMGRLEQILLNNGGARASQILKVGDRINVCGFPLKKDWNPDRMYADWPPEQGRFVHGQVFVMPDGRMQSWGPYGVITHCMRNTDTARAWITFLNRDPLAHRQWCEAQGTRGVLIDEVNRGLASKCR